MRKERSVQRRTKRSSPTRKGVFCGYWLDADGQRVRRVHRDEWASIYALWWRHLDVRCGVRLVGDRPGYWNEQARAGLES